MSWGNLQALTAEDRDANLVEALPEEYPEEHLSGAVHRLSDAVRERGSRLFPVRTGR